MERLDAFMARANAAYYATHDPFADFTTSPEISQVFGELLGAWAAVTWQMLGAPRPVLLVEAGPGRGTLMADALRAIAQVAPEFHAALSVHFIEQSARLRALQARRVPEARWHTTLFSVPHGPVILLANEFLDALPIRQFVRRGGAWCERYVDQGAFVEQELADVPDELPDALDAQIFEVCHPARDFVADVAGRIVRYGGAALFLDYGPEVTTCGDSLQAIAAGRPADPLREPGPADLTAHVDFESLARVARGCGVSVHGPKPQGTFLAELGLFQRTDRLARGQPPRRTAALIEAAQRLAEPDRMGRLFKAMGLGPPGMAGLPGF